MEMIKEIEIKLHFSQGKIVKVTFSGKIILATEPCSLNQKINSGKEWKDPDEI